MGNFRTAYITRGPVISKDWQTLVFPGWHNSSAAVNYRLWSEGIVWFPLLFLYFGSFPAFFFSLDFAFGKMKRCILYETRLLRFFSTYNQIFKRPYFDQYFVRSNFRFKWSWFVDKGHKCMQVKQLSKSPEVFWHVIWNYGHF